MKYFYLVVVVLFLLIGIQSPSRAEWTKTDTTLLVLRILDYKQTMEIATEKLPGLMLNNNDMTRFVHYERNPILGRHPSPEQVKAYFATLVLTDYLVAKYGSDKVHHFWLVTQIMPEVYCIGQNYGLGIKCKF